MAGPSRICAGFRAGTESRISARPRAAVTLSGVTDRSGADRCPGVLRPFSADDGAIIRVRVPGGRITAQTLAGLSAVAAEFGAPLLQLTSRGNIQLRGLPDPLPPELTSRIADLGLLPSPTHERVRNILAAPLAPQLTPLVAELDAGLRADAELAGLPGRFLWAISDATGAILTESYDVAFQQVSDHEGLVLVGNHAVGVSLADAVPTMLDRARRFLAHRADERTWNVRDLPPESPVFAGMSPNAVDPAPPLLPGPVGADLVVGVPLGMVRTSQVAGLTSLGDELVLTPWRSFVVPGGAFLAPVLRSLGLATDPDSPWARVSACIGAPYCRRTDVHTLDLATAASKHVHGPGPKVHVVGCERRCGEPSTDHLTIVAPNGLDDVLTAIGAST